MDLTGKIKTISIDYETNKPEIELRLNERECVDLLVNLRGDNLYVKIDKIRNKRSLDANSYMWVLCDKIAKALCKDGTIVTKEDVYKDSITQIGSFEPFIVQEKSFDKFKRIWEKQGLGFIVQEVSKKDKCVRVNCYYGSSTYDTKEMSLLIELLVELAKSLDIETKSEKEIESLLNSWGGNI